MSKKKAERNNPLLKKLDKWIGCPLVFTLGLLHKENIKPKNYQRIAVIKTAAVGDTIILSAMLDEIRYSYPHAQVTVICAKNNSAMVKALPYIGKVEVFAMKNPLQSLKRVRSLGHFDLVLDFGPWPRINAIITWVINADYKVGFKRKNMYRHYVYDVKVEHSDKVHEIENYRNILRGSGITLHGIEPDLHTLITHVCECNKYVVLHMLPGGSRSTQKCWPKKNWYELSKRLNDRHGYKILFSGSNKDKPYIDTLVEELKQCGIGAENIAGKYSLVNMATVLGNASLVVSVDTGIMHYAAAVGAKLIVLQGPTSPLRWGPLSKNAIVVSNNVCQPCLSLGFEYECKNNICMQGISVDMVMDAVKKIMEA